MMTEERSSLTRDDTRPSGMLIGAAFVVIVCMFRPCTEPLVLLAGGRGGLVSEFWGVSPRARVCEGDGVTSPLDSGDAEKPGATSCREHMP